MRYLLVWLADLHGRSGVGQYGYQPMTWTTLDAWARWTGNTPDAADVAALFALDAVMRNPGDPDAPEGT